MTVHTISVQGTPESPIIVEETTMTEETTKRLRTPNPYTQFAKAKAAADRARKGAARAVDLAEKARVASEKADALTALLADAEADEATALEALKAAIEGTGVDSDEEYDEDDE